MIKKLMIILFFGIWVFFAGMFDDVEAVHDLTISGDMTRYYVGDAYPQEVILAGYDLRSNRLHLNFDLLTTNGIAPGQTPVFSYYVEVYDGASKLIGRIKDPDGTPYDYNRPKTATGQEGLACVKVSIVVNMNDNGNLLLPAGYRVNVTVKEIQVL